MAGPAEGQQNKEEQDRMMTGLGPRTSGFALKDLPGWRPI
jgi:hypothetical protein